MMPYSWNPQKQQQSGPPGPGGGQQQQQQQPNPNLDWQQQQQAYAAQQYAQQQQQQQQQAYYQQYYQQQQQGSNQFNQGSMQQPQQQPYANNAQQSQFSNPMSSNYRPPPLPPGPPPPDIGNKNNISEYNQQYYGGHQQQQKLAPPPPPPSNNYNINKPRPPLPPSPFSVQQQQQKGQGQMYNTTSSNNQQQQQQLPNINQISNFLSSMKNLESIPGLDKGLEFLKNLNTNLGSVVQQKQQQQKLPNQNQQNVNVKGGRGGPGPNSKPKPLMSLQVGKPNQNHGQQQQQQTNQPSTIPSSTSNNIRPNLNSFLTSGSLIPNPLNSSFDKLLDKIDNNLLKTESNGQPVDPNRVLKGWKDNDDGKNIQNKNQNQQQRHQQDLVQVYDQETLDKFDKKFQLWEIDFEKWKSQNQNHQDRKNYLTYLGDWNKLRLQLVTKREIIIQKMKHADSKGKSNLETKINTPTSNKPMPIPEETLKSENSSEIKINKPSVPVEDKKPQKGEEESKPKSTKTENSIEVIEEPLHEKDKDKENPPLLPSSKLTPVKNKDNDVLIVLEKNVIENQEAPGDNSNVKEGLDDEIKRLMPKIRIPKIDDGNKSPPILRKGYLNRDQEQEVDRNQFNQPQLLRNPLNNPQQQYQQQQPGIQMQGQQQQRMFYNPQNNVNPFTQALQEQQQHHQQFNNQMNMNRPMPMNMNMNMNQNNQSFNQPQFPVDNNLRQQPFNPFIHNNSNRNFRELQQQQQIPLDDSNVQENENNYQNAEGVETISQFSRPQRPQLSTTCIAKTTEESTEVFDYGHAGEENENEDYDDIIHDRFQNEPTNEISKAKFIPKAPANDNIDDAPIVVDYGHGGQEEVEETPIVDLEAYRVPRVPPPPHLAGYYDGHGRIPHPPHLPPRKPYPYPSEEYYGYDYDYEYDYEDPRHLPPPPHMMGYPRSRFPPVGYPPHYPGMVRLPFKESKQPMAAAIALSRGFHPGFIHPIDPDYVEAGIVSPAGSFEDDYELAPRPIKEIRIAPPMNEIRIAPPRIHSEIDVELELERDRSRERRRRSRSRSPKRKSNRDKSPIHLHQIRDKVKVKDRDQSRERERDRSRNHSHSSSSRDKDRDRDRDRGKAKDKERSKSDRIKEDHTKSKDKDRSKSPAADSDRLKIGRNPAPPPPVPVSTPIPITRSSLQTTRIEDLINLPGRKMRPTQFVIFLRGLPGSGKSHLAQLIKNIETLQKGNAPRMLSIDDYFMIESEKSVKDPKSGKENREKIMIYEYDPDSEPTYRTDIIRALKKTIETGYFNFIIVDCVNETMEDIDEMSNYAALKRFKVYIAELEGTVNECYERNIHNRSLEDIQKLHDKWEQTPDYYIQLNIKGLFDDVQSDVEMEDVSDIENVGDSNNLDNVSPEVIDLEEDEDGEGQIGYAPSKWETIEHSEEKLNKLDGFKRKRKSANDDDSTPQSMEEWLKLQMSDIYVQPPVSGGKKRVRWADIAERQAQERMRDIGFVPGYDWNRVNDTTGGLSELVKTKFI